MSGTFGEMGNLLKQAQEMQRQLDQVRNDLRARTVEGQAAGGAVRIEISAEPGPDEVEVEVIDSGSETQARCRDGSPAHVIERLCGRQRHGHGLAIVERAVRQHGGRFDLRLSPQGSRADIRLPLAGRGGPGS